MGSGNRLLHGTVLRLVFSLFLLFFYFYVHCGQNHRNHLLIVLFFSTMLGGNSLAFAFFAFRDMSTKLQNGFYEFLRTRGVNDDLSKFLHEYMMNKDRIELIQWLQKLQSVFEN